MRVRALTLADVLDGMFELFTAHWRAYLLAIGPIVVPVTFLTTYLETTALGGAGLWEQFANPAATEAFATGGPSPAAFIGWVTVASLVSLFVTPFINGASCRIAAEGYQGSEPTPGAVLASTGRRYPALLGVTLLILLVAIVIVALPVALLVAAGVRTDALLAGIGGVLLFLSLFPLVAALIFFSLSYVCIVIEGASPVRALRRSYRLVRGRFWRVLGTLVLGGAIATFVALIVALPFQVPGDIWAAWIGVVLSSVGAVVASLLTTPLSANLQTLLYFDGRIRNEGYDVELLTREVEDAASERVLG